MTTGLKIVLFCLQWTAMLPLKYNFNEGKFKKSQNLYIYSITINVLFIVMYFYCGQYLAFLFIDLSFVHYMKIILSILWFTSFIQINAMLFEKIFKINKLVDIFNEIFECYDQLIGCFKLSLENRLILITIIELTVFPIIVILINCGIWKIFTYDMWIYYNILLIISMWAVAALLPLYLAFQVLTCFLDGLKNDLFKIVYEINFGNPKNLSSLCNAIDRIAVLHTKVARLISKLMNQSNIYVIANIFGTSFNIVWQSYRLIATLLTPGIQLNIILAVLFHFIVDSFFCGKILILFVACAHSLCRQFSESGQALQCITVEILDFELKENVIRLLLKNMF